MSLRDSHYWTVTNPTPLRSPDRSGFGIEETPFVPQLKRVHLENYRSIQNADIEFGRLNVLIGANGSGKSNLISFFKMMNEMTRERLQEYIATTGRAQSILHFGPKVSSELKARLKFQVDEETRTYALKMIHAPGDTLCFADESIRVDSMAGTRDTHIGVGHLESNLEKSSEGTPSKMCKILRQCRVFHFHDTSSTARPRQYCYANDSRTLKHDGANLAAVLLGLRQNHPTSYRRIIETIQLIAPYFDDFILEPTSRSEVIIDWRHKGSDLTFGPHQFSDGTLRSICLVTLLLQPPEDQPLVLIVDEPELGLHPYALSLIASLFRAASEHVQVIISTQSSTFLDHFDPEDVIVAEHHDGKSTFHRPGAEKLEAWLEEYSLGEIWEKNVIGGGPH